MTIFFGVEQNFSAPFMLGQKKQQAAALLCAVAVTEGTGTLLCQTHPPLPAGHCPRSHHKPWPKSSGFGCTSAGRAFGQRQSPSQAGSKVWKSWAGSSSMK